MGRLFYEVAVNLLNAYIRFWRRRDLTWRGQAKKLALRVQDQSGWRQRGLERVEIANFLLALSKVEGLSLERRWALVVAFRAVSRGYKSVFKGLAEELRKTPGPERMEERE